MRIRSKQPGIVPIRVDDCLYPEMQTKRDRGVVNPGARDFGVRALADKLAKTSSGSRFQVWRKSMDFDLSRSACWRLLAAAHTFPYLRSAPPAAPPD